MTVTGNFRQALNKTLVGGNKTNFINGNEIQTTSGKLVTIRNWCFYKPSDPFMKKDAEVVYSGPILGVPSMQIPMPAVKRIADFDGNKFFIQKLSQQHATLSAPWHYFYFEKREEKIIKGYRQVFKEKWVSKLDMGIAFYSGNDREEIIPELKEEAFSIYGKIYDLDRELLHLYGSLDKLDPARKLAQEYKEVQAKLEASLKAFGDL